MTKAFLDIGVLKHLIETQGRIPLGQLTTMFGTRPSDSEYGPKSTMLYYQIQQAIQQGAQVLYINMESTIDDARFQLLGLDNK